MKKLINKVEDVVPEALAGMAAAHADMIKVFTNPNYIVRADAPVQGKVGVISGGGSGHEPMHGGFVGMGMLDAACPGAVFTSPTPDQMLEATKAVNGGADNIMVCERGASFGYNTLVSDMRGLAVMRNTDCPVVFDATHSVQQPGGQGDKSGGQREHVPVLARAAVASGIAGLFMETHPNPAEALSDGPNAWPLGKMKALLSTLVEIDRLVKQHGFIEQTL